MKLKRYIFKNVQTKDRLRKYNLNKGNLSRNYLIKVS